MYGVTSCHRALGSHEHKEMLLCSREGGRVGNVIGEAKGLSWAFSHLQGIRIINVRLLLSLFP